VGCVNKARLFKRQPREPEGFGNQFLVMDIGIVAQEGRGENI
jgi:hypothetical protein